MTAMYWSLNSPACCYSLVSSGCKGADWWTLYEFYSTLSVITTHRPMLIRVNSSSSLTPRVILTALLSKGFSSGAEIDFQGYFKASFTALVKVKSILHSPHFMPPKNSLVPRNCVFLTLISRQQCDRLTYIHHRKHACQFAFLRIRI
jgi:hypothetical protein